MKNQVRTYFNEAKWFLQKYTPTAVKYMHTAIVSSGFLLLAITSFGFGFGFFFFFGKSIAKRNKGTNSANIYITDQ
jgi:hypothetical protein